MIMMTIIYMNKLNYKEHMQLNTQFITVKLICNWDKDLTKKWNYMIPKDSKIQFVSGKNIKADYYVIINFPIYNEYYEPKKTILFHMEPLNYYSRAEQWRQPNHADFFQVISHKNGYNNIEWFISKNIDTLRNEQIKKSSVLSMVLSDYYIHPGHKLRVNFAKFLDNIDIQIDIYGRCRSLNLKKYKGELPDLKKDEALYPYKYSIAVENNSEFNYFTEKISDCILSECLCFYWGAPNIDNYYPNAFIRLDLSDFSKAHKQITDAIKNNEWERRLPMIKKAKNKILYEMNLVNRLENIIGVK